jgi:hypothetical protein
MPKNNNPAPIRPWRRRRQQCEIERLLTCIDMQLSQFIKFYAIVFIHSFHSLTTCIVNGSSRTHEMCKEKWHKMHQFKWSMKWASENCRQFISTLRRMIYIIAETIQSCRGCSDFSVATLLFWVYLYSQYWVCNLENYVFMPIAKSFFLLLNCNLLVFCACLSHSQS